MKITAINTSKVGLTYMKYREEMRVLKSECENISIDISAT
jgi:hypothetical protein